MKYEDGYATNDKLRFSSCPRCGNEKYSENAQYCRICGLPAYNECEGQYKYDEYGNPDGHIMHKNHGNARYCECCGTPTMLLKEQLLKPYLEANSAK